MGAIATIGANAPENFIHIILNNEAHDSVGGQETVAKFLDFQKIFLGCNYKSFHKFNNLEDFKKRRKLIMAEKGPIAVELVINKGARTNLGRPIEGPAENKTTFMSHLKQ